ALARGSDDTVYVFGSMKTQDGFSWRCGRLSQRHLAVEASRAGAAPERALPVYGQRMAFWKAVARVLLPPYRGRDHHAAARLAVDARPERVAAAGVEHAHAVAFADTARRGVVWMHVQMRLALELSE